MPKASGAKVLLRTIVALRISDECVRQVSLSQSSDDAGLVQRICYIAFSRNAYPYYRFMAAVAQQVQCKLYSIPAHIPTL